MAKKVFVSNGSVPRTRLICSNLPEARLRSTSGMPYGLESA
jgi:hypothetical protein